MYFLRHFLPAFFLSFFCFSLMIMTTVLWVHPFRHQPLEPAPQYLFLPTDKEQLNLLLIHENHSFSLLSFHPQNGRIELQSIPFHSTVDGHSLPSLYNIGRKNSTKSILSVYFGTDIDKIAVLNDKNLCRIIDLLGGVTLKLDKDFSYRQSDMEINFAPGIHQLNGEQCLHYLTEISSAESTRWIQLLSAMTEQFLAASPNKNFRELYSKLLDHADSDLTIADYDRCYEAMRFIANVVEKPVQIKNRPHLRSAVTADVLSTE